MDSIVLAEPTPALKSNVTESANQTLTCCDMWLDGIKWFKTTCDPVSDGVGALFGFLCCVATVVAQAKENDRPATRHDVLYAAQERRNDAAELGCAYSTGACIGDIVVDSSAILCGSVVGGIRAAGLSFFGNNDRNNTVFNTPRERIDQVQLFSSCCMLTSAQ